MMLSCDIEGGDVGGGVEIDGLDNETMGVVRLNGLMQNSGPSTAPPPNGATDAGLIIRQTGAVSNISITARNLRGILLSTSTIHTFGKAPSGWRTAHGCIRTCAVVDVSVSTRTYFHCRS